MFDKFPDPLAWLVILFVEDWGKCWKAAAWAWWCHRLVWCWWWWWACSPNSGWPLKPVSCWVIDGCNELDGARLLSSSISVICVSPKSCSLLLLLSRSDGCAPLLWGIFNRVKAPEFAVPTDAPSPSTKTKICLKLNIFFHYFYNFLIDLSYSSSFASFKNSY